MTTITPKIRKIESINDAVFSLTCGFIRVMTNAKYFFVEDEDDKKFYDCIYKILMKENKIKKQIPLSFLPISTRHEATKSSGGKNKIKNIIELTKKLREVDGEIFYGLVDKDCDSPSDADNDIFQIGRYSIENYLVDPILIYAASIQQNCAIQIPGISYDNHEISQINSCEQADLQKIADFIFKKLSYRPDNEQKIMQVRFVNGLVLNYPTWMRDDPGKNIKTKVINTFSNQINFDTLLKAFETTRFIPVEIFTLFESMSLLDSQRKELSIEAEVLI